MVGFKRRRYAAVSTAAAVETHQVKPLRGCIGTERGDLSGTPQPSDDAHDLGIREAVGDDRRFRTLPVPRVVIALVRAILVTMRRAPAAHRFARSRRVSLDPLAAVRATDFRIRMRHEHSISRDQTSLQWDCEAKNAAGVAALCVRCCGETIRTSDLRVMSPSSYRCSTPRTDSTSYRYRAPKKNANHRPIRDGPSLTTRANASLACPSRCTAMIDSFGAM